MALSRSTRTTHRESIDDTIRRLETLVGRMERRYERASASMARAIQSGEVQDTAEIARWLSDYRTLLRLRRLLVAEDRTDTTTTG